MCFICSFSRSSSRSYVHINWVYGDHICHSALDIYVNHPWMISSSLSSDHVYGFDSPCFNASTVSYIMGDLVSSEWNIVSLTLSETQDAFPNYLSKLFPRWISFDKFSTNCVSFQLLSFAHVTSDVSALLTYPDTFQGVTCLFFHVPKSSTKIVPLEYHFIATFIIQKFPIKKWSSFSDI